MFAEFAKIMDYAIHENNFTDSLYKNVLNKKSKSGVEKTSRYLKTLYGFDCKKDSFRALKYFWGISDEKERPLLAFIFAINNDDLLAESIGVVRATKVGGKAAIEFFDDNIEKYHPNRYSINTRRSTAQNIASSWKQAEFIVGKVKNIRTQPEIKFRVVCFAFLLAYLKGNRGDFIWNSIGVKALCLNVSKLRELAIECARRDMMQYQFAGSVTSISFNNLLNKIGINAV